MSGLRQHQSLTSKKYEVKQPDHSQKFETSQDGFRGYFLWLAGSEERARQFLSPRGVAIGAFSQMVGLPVSTVRHYARLGLIEPWIVDRKYRFNPINLMQLELVKQWTSLGISLQQIQERETQQPAKRPAIMVQDILGPLRLSDEVLSNALVDIEGIFEPNGYTENGHVNTLDIENTHPEQLADWNPRPVLADLLHEYSDLLNRLEKKRLEVEKRISRAREIENELAKTV